MCTARNKNVVEGQIPRGIRFLVRTVQREDSQAGSRCAKGVIFNLLFSMFTFQMNQVYILGFCFFHFNEIFTKQRLKTHVKTEQNLNYGTVHLPLHVITLHKQLIRGIEKGSNSQLKFKHARFTLTELE